MGVKKNEAKARDVHAREIKRLHGKLRALVATLAKDGMTQQAIADASGISRGTLLDLLNNDANDPQLSSILGVLYALKMAPEIFFAKTPGKYSHHPDEEIHRRFQAILDIDKHAVNSWLKGCEIEYFGETPNPNTSDESTREVGGQTRGDRK